MKIGELHKARDGMSEPLDVMIARTVGEALTGYPNANGDAITALCLRIAQMTRFRDERIAALNSNAWQAGEIARLTAALNNALIDRDACLAAKGGA